MFSVFTLIFTAVIEVAFFARYPYRYIAETEAAAKQYGIDVYILRGIIWTESKFESDALSPKGALGLMQLMPRTAKSCAESMGVEYSDEMLFEPSYNINIGAYYYKYLLQKFKDEQSALAAYNAGETVVAKWIKEGVSPQYAETREYIKRVLNAKEIYSMLDK